MFASLPTGFLRLRQTVENMGQFKAVAPPKVEELGLRMRKIYAQARGQGYQTLSRGAIRRLPYALWVEGHEPLQVTDPALVSTYWEQHLPQALSQARAARRWLAPLFFTYCHAFNRNRADFQLFAQKLRASLGQAQGPFAAWIKGLHQDHRWLVPDEVGGFLGQKLATAHEPLPQLLQQMSLWSGFLEAPLAAEAFAGALRLPNEQLSREPVIERIKGWARMEFSARGKGSIFRYPEHRVLLADGLVRPWLKMAPPDPIRNGLLSFYMKHYGDPRLLSATHQGHHWQGVAPETVTAVRRWLVGDTMRGFMRVLKLTNDQIWPYREKFWMAYYENGAIEEAWFALGSQAGWLAKREFGQQGWSQYGLLTTGAANDQSVLFMRIGHIVFMEWSHNGSLRALRQDDPQLPAMYQSEYSGNEVRQVYSMDFHGGVNTNPQLTHSNSEGGTWQRKARDFIAHHTGVKLNDKAILG